VTAAVLASAAVTAVVTVHPQFRFASGQTELRATFGTAVCLIALLAGFLTLGRFRRRARLADLALVGALGVLVPSTMLFATLPSLSGVAASDFFVWPAIIGPSLGSLLFAATAVVPARRVRRAGCAQVTATVCIVLAFGLMTALGRVLVAHLPVAVTVLPVTSPAPPVLHAGAGLATLEMLAAVLDALAALIYLGRARTLGREFSAWLAVASVFAAAAHLNYFLYPSLYAQVVSVGDVFWFSFWAVLLAGAMRETWCYWRDLADLALVTERRRIARDLHDGLAQELAYLTRNLAALDGHVEQEVLNRLHRAAERARQQSRLAISGITYSGRASATDGLADAVRETAKRLGVELELDLPADIRLRPGHCDALVRIACEAVANAARHSGAGRVSLSVARQGSRVRLCVRDSGAGFDPGGPTAGHGLTSMRERAQSVGGNLLISSAPGRGTEIEAIL
jgi:signal transduction histidine kinase